MKPVADYLSGTSHFSSSKKVIIDMVCTVEAIEEAEICQVTIISCRCCNWSATTRYF